VRLTVLTVIALFAASIRAQQPAAPPPQAIPTLTAIARSVVLDVAVVDAHGHPVKGLKQSDFLLLEDGVPQTLKSFQEHVSGPAVAAPPTLPPNTFSNYAVAPNSDTSTVLLLDALDTSITAQMYLHEQVVQYMKHVPAGTSMAIFLLDDRIRLIQGFTTDPHLLLSAVESKRNNPHFGVYSGGAATLQRMRHYILTDAMKELGRYLAGFPGRKNLIWFTGTVPREVYDNGRALGGHNDPIGNPFRDSSAFVDNFNPDDFSQATDVLSLSRIAVFPIDARGLVAPSGGRQPHLGSELGFDHSSLDEVAEATGGKAFYNTNGLKDAIAEVVASGSDFYTVSYTPTDKNWNGAFRKIKVQLNANLDVHLEYRSGYRANDREAQDRRHLASVQRKKASGNFTLAAETQAPGVMLHRGPQETLQASMTLGAIAPTELIFAASLTPAAETQKIEKNTPLPPGNYLRPAFTSKPFRDYNILYATDTRTLGLTLTPGGLRSGQLDFVAVVYNDQGDVVNSLITTVQVDLKPATYQHLIQTGMSMTQRIAIPLKGTYFLRLGIRDAAADRVGALEIPLDQVKLGVAGAGQSLAPATP
jgi:VWFA-related protein